MKYWNIFSIFIYTFIVLSVKCENDKKDSPPVKISLQTPWDNTPLILEAM